MTINAGPCQKERLYRKWSDVYLQIKSVAAAWLLLSSHRETVRHLTTGSAFPSPWAFLSPVANNAPAGGGLWGALRALVDAVHSHRRSGSLKKKTTFEDFHRVPGCFPVSAEKPWRIRCTGLCWSGWASCWWSKVSDRWLRRSLALCTCMLVVAQSRCAYIWHCAGDLSRSLKKEITEVQLSCTGAWLSCEIFSDWSFFFLVALCRNLYAQSWIQFSAAA